jgi:hypothetical protein
MSDRVSLSMRASNPDQFRMRVVIEEDSFRVDKEKLRYSPEQLDEILRSPMNDLAKKPEDYQSVGLGFEIVRIDAEPPLYILYELDTDCVRLYWIKEDQ